MALDPDFTLTSGDTGPPITAQLTDAAGVGVNLSGTTVTFRMATRSGVTPKVNAAATLVTPTIGEVSYQWILADTDTPGYYLARWRVTYPTGVVESFPNDTDPLILVRAAV